MRKFIATILFAVAACSANPSNDVTETHQALSLPTASTGVYEARLVPFEADRAWVQSLLPPQLELGPTVLAHGTKHPVFLLHQHYVSVGQPGGPQNPGWNELSLYIVDLKLKDGKADCAQGKNGPFSYLPIMHVDGGPIVIAQGNQFYGLNQHSATITNNTSVFNADSTDTTAPLTYRASFGTPVALTPYGAANMVDIEAALSAPVLGSNTPAGLVFHQTDWKFTDPTTVIKSIPAVVVADSPLAPFSFFFTGNIGVDVQQPGAFYVKAPFESTIPAFCTSL